jgi:hypothetical protein
MINLPLNNNLITFTNSYSGSVNIYEKNNTTHVFGNGWGLKPTETNKSSLTADLSGSNSIIFSPTIVEDDNSFWFIKDEDGNYVPQKRFITTLHQSYKSNLNNIFEFKAKISEITLKTNYGSENYNINAFIGAYEKDALGNIIKLAETFSPVNTLGNFEIQLDTTSILNISYIQWGFKMSGYPVYPSESGNQGCVKIDNHD